MAWFGRKKKGFSELDKELEKLEKGFKGREEKKKGFELKGPGEFKHDLGFGSSTLGETPTPVPLPSYGLQEAPLKSSDDNYIVSKNLEVISSKIDALRAAIESLNQRVKNIERIAMREQEEYESQNQ